MSILVIGKTGQLARALDRELAGQNATFLDRAAFDLSADPDVLRSVLDAGEIPTVIINAAAYTAVDAAEEDETTAYDVNSRAPKVLAQYCLEHEIPLIHVSTDYVFNGKKRMPYLPTDKVDPLGVYGSTKLAGEEYILHSGCKGAILRTSWVYDGYGKNFLTTMLRLAQSRTELRVVEDQIGRPTYTGDLAKACLTAAKHSQKAGDSARVYHVSNTGIPTSWAGFAKSIFETAAEHLPHEMDVTGIPSHEYPTPAKRPSFSVMDCSDFERDMNVILRDWTAGMEDAITEWTTQK